MALMQSITNLTQQSGMTTFETMDESRISFDLGGLKEMFEYDDVEEEYYQMLEDLVKAET